MKIQGHGQAKVLSPTEIDKLFLWGFTNKRDRALFAVCLHTGCRISEALALTVNDLAGGHVTLRKRTTKGKRATRTIPITPQLKEILDAYLEADQPTRYLFPGHWNAKTTKQMTRSAADLILKEACQQVGLVGVSTHSFRRTALTQMSNAGIPLPVIQRISGHRDLATLQRYLEISDQQVVEAVNTIGSHPPRQVIREPQDSAQLID